jgi:hypothetical protein
MNLPDRFHVHIVNANHIGWMGCTVGQAHLLDDIISLVSPFDAILESLTDAKSYSARARARDGPLYHGTPDLHVRHRHRARTLSRAVCSDGQLRRVKWPSEPFEVIGHPTHSIGVVARIELLDPSFGLRPGYLPVQHCCLEPCIPAPWVVLVRIGYSERVQSRALHLGAGADTPWRYSS